MINNGQFRIVSHTEGRPPTGVNYTKPAWQTVRLNQPIQSWSIKRVGDHAYRLSIGGYRYTGVLDSAVTASVHPEHDMEFYATYREAQDGYTIELADDRSKGWTVAPDSSTDSGVQIRQIIETSSLPPQFLTTQLFSFEPIHE